MLRRARSRSLFEKGLLMWLFAQVPCSSVGFPEQLHRKLHPHSSLASSVVYLPKVSRLISHVGVEVKKLKQPSWFWRFFNKERQEPQAIILVWLIIFGIISLRFEFLGVLSLCFESFGALSLCFSSFLFLL